MNHGWLRQLYAISRYALRNLVILWLSAVIILPCYASNPDVNLSVWVNEAIVAAYTFDAADKLDSQKALAKYFTAEAWIKFVKALDTAKLKESVQKNHYTVSAVALLPPAIKALHVEREWQATMPLLVLYKNKKYQQKQTLNVVITFIKVHQDEGVRGFAITSFNTVVTTPACQCMQRHSIKTIV